MPFVSYALISKTIASAALRRIAKYQITPLLTGIPGVRRVGVLGGQTPEVQVAVNPREAARLRLDPGRRRRRRSPPRNTIKAVGRLEDNDLLYLAVSNNAIQLGRSRSGTSRCTPGADGIVRLGDLATVKMGARAAMAAGRRQRHARRSPSMSISRTAPIRSASRRRCSQRLDAFMKTQPEVHPSAPNGTTRPQLVRSSIGAVEEAILIGLVFAGLRRARPSCATGASRWWR